MKETIHPATTVATLTCSTCGTAFETRSTRAPITVDVCSACHPAYTGAGRTARASSRIERFERRRAASRSLTP